jgi:hypothetical protein
MGRGWGRCNITALAGKFRAIPRAMAIVANHFIPPIPDIYNPAFP